MELKNSSARNFRLAELIDHFGSFFSWENAVRWRLNLIRQTSNSLVTRLVFPHYSLISNVTLPE